MKTILAVAALAAAWSGTPASARTTTASLTRVVAIRDLDLSRPADMAKLDHRITLAAHRVCMDGGSALYGNYAAARACVRDAKRVASSQRDAAVAAARGVTLAAR